MVKADIRKCNMTNADPMEREWYLEKNVNSHLKPCNLVRVEQARYIDEYDDDMMVMCIGGFHKVPVQCT